MQVLRRQRPAGGGVQRRRSGKRQVGKQIIPDCRYMLLRQDDFTFIHNTPIPGRAFSLYSPSWNASSIYLCVFFFPFLPSFQSSPHGRQKRTVRYGRIFIPDICNNWRVPPVRYILRPLPCSSLWHSPSGLPNNAKAPPPISILPESPRKI